MLSRLAESAEKDCTSFNQCNTKISAAFSFFKTTCKTSRLLYGVLKGNYVNVLTCTL